MVSFKSKAFVVGVVGDILLQILTKESDIAGLRKYFDIHGSIESVTIAGGMMYAFGSMYELSGLPLNNMNLALYGGSLDMVFRHLRVFPSLDSYYDALDPVESVIWGVIPMVMPNLL